MAERRADIAEQRAVEADKRADAALVVADRTLAQLADANARAERADAAIAGERARADALRQRVDELQAGQQLMLDTHALALTEAHAQLERVREAAEDMRQAEAGRKGRGRLRRAWEAWRGV